MGRTLMSTMIFKANKFHFLSKHDVRRFTPFTSVRESRGPSYFHCVGAYPLVHRTIGEQLELAASNFGDREAFVFCHEQKRWTFTEILKSADILAAALYKIGLQRGDRLAICAPNYSHWVLSMLAAARAGFVSVGINPAFQSNEMKYCLNKINAKAIVASETYKTQNYYEILERIVPEISKCSPGKLRSSGAPSLQSVIIDSESSLPGVFRFKDLMKKDFPEKDQLEQIAKTQQQIDPDSASNIQFTSGTTGLPKATVLSHFNVVNNGIHTGTRNASENQRICINVPVFHAYGLILGVGVVIGKGSTLIFPDAGFNACKALRTIVNEQCSVVYGTPTMYVDLIVEQKKLNLPLKIEIALTGGASCSPQLLKGIKNDLNVKKVTSAFGMTETTAATFQTKPTDSDNIVSEYVGHVQDHMEAKVIDANGNIVPFGQPGELCIRGYSTMLGYFGDDDKTKEMIGNDKWLKTRDQFILEESGYGRIVGRIKEMIIRGGENIFPKEVEDYLNTHSNIAESHVIGVPDERLGEEICAFIRLRDDKCTINESEIKAFCKGNIAHFKIPKYVRTIREFPKTTSGKIQKFKLVQIFNESSN